MSMFRPAFAVCGLVLLVLSVLMLIPLVLVIFDSAPDAWAFFASSGITAVSGLLLFMTNRGAVYHLTPKKMFLITAINWISVAVFASIPFHLSTLHLSFTNAVFESVSGITTTGSTVLTGLDSLPKDILLKILFLRCHCPADRKRYCVCY